MKKIAIVFTMLIAGCQAAPDFSQMTPQQIMAYQQMVAQQQAYDQAMLANITAGNQALVAGSRYPTMATPQVTPVYRPGGNQVRCINTGIYTNCRY